MSPVQAPRWNDDELEVDRLTSIGVFRDLRMREPVEAYQREFESGRAGISRLLAMTGDLTALSDYAVEVLTDATLKVAVRYLTAPPISEDDLEVLAEGAALSESRLRADPEMAKRVLEVIVPIVDYKRFPWVPESRKPSSNERDIAIIATASMIAQRAVMTARANLAKTLQEGAVRTRLLELQMLEVDRRRIDNMSHAPDPGCFCSESLVVGRKADLVVRLHDGRLLPIECKVSNSYVNSVKRLNNDAAVKSLHWRNQLGPANVIPAAVLSGVYNIGNLRSAQDDGHLTIFWAHDLEPLASFIVTTNP